MLTTKSAHRKDISTGLAGMDHRHFATIATIIRDMDKGLVACSTDATRAFVADLFAEKLGRTNPRFNRARFLLACQPQADAHAALADYAKARQARGD